MHSYSIKDLWALPERLIIATTKINHQIFIDLGIDNFAIRKGHMYNTGLHDLRGGIFLDVIPGRKMEE